jgi:hypothetical protein
MVEFEQSFSQHRRAGQRRRPMNPSNHHVRYLVLCAIGTDALRFRARGNLVIPEPGVNAGWCRVFEGTASVRAAIMNEGGDELHGISIGIPPGKCRDCAFDHNLRDPLS